MTTRASLLLLFIVTAFISSASTITFMGPTTPSGAPCDPSGPQCVNGANYEVYGVQLSQPTTPNGDWTLTIEENYPNNPTPLVAGNVIPPEESISGALYSTADFLINWNGTDYGVVLAPHVEAGASVDNYQAGNLYQAPNTQFDTVLSGQQPPNPPGVLDMGSTHPGQPVWLSPGGTLLGTGTVSVALGGNGTPAQYTVTDVFSAPADFLATGSFTITADSFVCANGLVEGTGSFSAGGGGSSGGGSNVPEPGSFLLAFPALLLGYCARRARQRGRSTLSV